MYLPWLFVFVTVLSSTSAVEPDEKYDLIVIGRGPGGLAAAKEAYENHKKNVLVIDYLTESLTKGTPSYWGDDGTCVFRGCVPKRLIHQATIIGDALNDGSFFGWDIENHERIDYEWENLIKAIELCVKKPQPGATPPAKEDTGYKSIDGLAEFVDKNTIKVVTNEKEKTVWGEDILIAVGSRHIYPEIPGINHAITCDEVFNRNDPPGKTLIIGVSYIGVECAGFLSGLGTDVTVIDQSETLLQGFDGEMAKMVKQDLLNKRVVKFLDQTMVSSIAELVGSSYASNTPETSEIRQNPKKNRFCVWWMTKNGEAKGDGIWDTVIIATGLRALTDKLKVENANVEVEANGYINVNNKEQTNIQNIYAVGDVLYGKPHLTPVAIQAARLLMDRLYGGSSEEMDYNNVPTTVFTPLEYSFVGLSTEQVANREDVEIYHSKFNPTEFATKYRGDNRCYLRVICKKGEDDRILGMHLFGLTTGEVIQGYAAALKAGLTFKQLTNTVAIHPTTSEEFVRVHITVASGEDPAPQSCCS